MASEIYSDISLRLPIYFEFQLQQVCINSKISYLTKWLELKFFLTTENFNCFLFRILMWHDDSYFSRKSANWWRRRKATDYLPAYSADNKPLIDYLTKLKLLGQSDRLENSNLTLKYMLDIIWSFFESFLEPQFLIWALAGQAATVIVCFLWKI